MQPLTVTVDTGVLDGMELLQLQGAASAAGFDAEWTIVTAAARERGSFDTSMLDTMRLSISPEPMVWGVSRWGEGAWGTDQPFTVARPCDETGTLAKIRGHTRFEAILAIISNRSFPPAGQRDALSKGHRNQLLDAMILEAHARDGRDVFVTVDGKGFIDDGRRQLLEAICDTDIVHRDEFTHYCERTRRAAGHHPTF